MRKIKAIEIKDAVKDLFLQANFFINDDILDELKDRCKVEESPIGQSVLEQIIKNNEIAADEEIAICQDTGFSVVFVELGQEVTIVDGDFNEAINQGVKEAYEEGYLRKSIVDDPIFERENTKDNTPPVTHVEIVAGDKVRIVAVAKGFGSENMSKIKMLRPADGVQGVKDFIIQSVVEAGPNPCPPIIVGVGVGGTFEMSAILAKKATIRPIGTHNKNPKYAKLEKELLQEINNLGIGPGGLGGNTSALAVNIDYYPTHIAGLPLAVNICCHASRHAEKTI